MQALAQLWGRGAKDFAAAQQGMWFDMGERMAKAQEGGPAAAQAASRSKSPTVSL